MIRHLIKLLPKGHLEITNATRASRVIIIIILLISQHLCALLPSAISKFEILVGFVKGVDYLSLIDILRVCRLLLSISAVHLGAHDSLAAALFPKPYSKLIRVYLGQVRHVGGLIVPYLRNG